MATGPLLRVTGLKKLNRDLRKFAGDAEDLKDANAAAAGIVAVAARARTPRRTGLLASTVRGNRAAGRARVSAGTAAVPYASVVHWGWPARGIEPRPFVVDAAQATEPIWLEAYRAGLIRATRRVSGSY